MKTPTTTDKKRILRKRGIFFDHTIALHLSEPRNMSSRQILTSQHFAITIDRLCYQLIENHGDFSDSSAVKNLRNTSTGCLQEINLEGIPNNFMESSSKKRIPKIILDEDDSWITWVGKSMGNGDRIQRNKAWLIVFLYFFIQKIFQIHFKSQLSPHLLESHQTI